jgi:sugar lactone lactonase YvrE
MLGPISMSKIGPISVTELKSVGNELYRPECVVTTATHLFVPDWRGGITRIRPDGACSSILAQDSSIELRPNGIALTRERTFLLANLGADGGVWRLDSRGNLEPFVIQVDGVPVPPANFVLVDRRGRTWISISTRQVPRQSAWRPDVADGFIVLVDERGARIVADGLRYTNEVRLDPSGRWLYAVETFGRRLVRFPIANNGDLGTPSSVVALEHGTFPDGFAFDVEGGIWITSLVSNRLLRLVNDALETIIEDSDPEYVTAVEQAFLAGQMRSEHLGPVPGRTLQQLTSLAFGGVDMRTVYLGSLHADCLYRCRVPVAGVAEAHWHFPSPWP